MEERPSLSAETQLVDDGTGTLKVWRIKHDEIVEIPKERHTFFFSDDCYIVLYSYQISADQKHLLYCWLVSNNLYKTFRKIFLKQSSSFQSI